MINTQMIGPIAILDHAQKAIITELIDRRDNGGRDFTVLADALVLLYHAEDYLFGKRK